MAFFNNEGVAPGQDFLRFLQTQPPQPGADGTVPGQAPGAPPEVHLGTGAPSTGVPPSTREHTQNNSFTPVESQQMAHPSQGVRQAPNPDRPNAAPLSPPSPESFLGPNAATQPPPGQPTPPMPMNPTPADASTPAVQQLPPPDISSLVSPTQGEKLGGAGGPLLGEAGGLLGGGLHAAGAETGEAPLKDNLLAYLLQLSQNRQK